MQLPVTFIHTYCVSFPSRLIIIALITFNEKFVNKRSQFSIPNMKRDKEKQKLQQATN